MDAKSQKIIDDTNAMLDRITEDLKAAYPRCSGPDRVTHKPDLRRWFLDGGEILIDLKEIEKWIADGLSWEAIRLQVSDRIRTFLYDAVNDYLQHIKGI